MRRLPGLAIIHFFTAITTHNTWIKLKSAFWMYTTMHIS